MTDKIDMTKYKIGSAINFYMKYNVRNKTHEDMIVNKEVLQQQIRNIRMAFEMGDNEATKIIHETIADKCNDEDIFFEYVRALVNWHFYLSYYISKEDYEFCAELRDVIFIEKIETEFMLIHHFPESEYIDEIQPTLEEVRKMFNV